MLMDVSRTGQPRVSRLSREHASGLLWYDTQEMATRMRNEVVSAALEACPAESRDCLQAAMGGAELSFEQGLLLATAEGDRKSTRLNSSHRCISYAVFCLKKKT